MAGVIVIQVDSNSANRVEHMLNHIVQEYDARMAVAYPGRPVVTNFDYSTDVFESQIQAVFDTMPK